MSLTPLPVAGDRGQSEQHAVSGRVRSVLWAVVPRVGRRPPNSADAVTRQSSHRHLPSGHARSVSPAPIGPPTLQESRLKLQAQRDKAFCTNPNSSSTLFYFIFLLTGDEKRPK